MPIKLTKGIQGSGDVRRNLALIIKQYPQEVMKATKTELQVEKEESVRRTPWLTRKLQRSHRVVEPELRGGRIYSGVSAGNEETEDYDVTVHEDLDAFHPRGGQAKFLESTWLEAAPHLARRIGARVALKVIIES